MIPLIPFHHSRPADDAIFALNAEATARRKRGESIVNATVGALLEDDGQLAVLPSAAQAVREVPPEEWAAYAPIAGNPAFLAAVQDDLLGTVPALRACSIAVATPGGSGALRHALTSYLEPEQSMLTASYYWGPYQTLSEVSDRHLTTFNFFARPDGQAFDVEAFDRALSALVDKQGRALIFLNDPCNNPTGYSMSDAEFDAVVQSVGRHAESAPVTLLLDLAYADYAASDPRARLAALTPLLGKAGLCFAWSASKSFTHYGLRVGALVACIPDEKERRMTEAAFSYESRGTWSNCVRGGMTAITRLLTAPHLSTAVVEERARLKALLSARVGTFNRHAHAAGLVYPRYEGGFFVTVFRDGAKEHALRMKEQGVFVVPSQGALRVALCSVAERDIERLVGSLFG